jgi:hypothetical protein
MYGSCVAGKLVFKLMSTVTLYSVTLLTAVNVGTVLILTERFGKLSLGGSTLEEVILEMNLSSGFTALILIPFVHVTEIWKRIEFINSWGTFQVYIYIYIYSSTRGGKKNISGQKSQIGLDTKTY